MESRIFEDKIGRCENREEYERLVRDHANLYVGWREHITPLLRAKGLTAKTVAEGCKVSRNCALQFFRMIPARRENVIMLAAMMGMPVEEANRLLMRWAKFQRLYPKHPGDFIWIYLLENGGCPNPKERFDAYYAWYQTLQDKYRKNGALAARPPGVMETRVAIDFIHRTIETDVQSQAGSLPADPVADARFTDMVWRLLPSFEAGYRNLMNYIDGFFRDVEREDNRLLGLGELNRRRGIRRQTPNAVFRQGRWLDLYFRKMRELREEHRIPGRTFLIALGLRLSMNTDQINELLTRTGMGPLCPKDRLEGTIVFYLEELYLQFPTFFRPADLEIHPEYRDLMDYSRQDADSWQGGTPLPSYVELDADDYPREDLTSYIRRRLEETNLFDDDEKSAVQKFLQLL